MTIVILYCSILSGLGAPGCMSSNRLLIAFGVIEKMTSFLWRGLQSIGFQKAARLVSNPETNRPAPPQFVTWRLVESSSESRIL
jgi:hypothetical protein